MLLLYLRLANRVNQAHRLEVPITDHVVVKVRKAEGGAPPLRSL
jgi:hypothetical protein